MSATFLVFGNVPSATAQQEKVGSGELSESKEVLPSVIAAIASLIAAGVSVFIALRINKLSTLAELDKGVHEERLKAYPQLVQATAPFALYFSHTD